MPVVDGVTHFVFVVFARHAEGVGEAVVDSGCTRLLVGDLKAGLELFDVSTLGEGDDYAPRSLKKWACRASDCITAYVPCFARAFGLCPDASRATQDVGDCDAGMLCGGHPCGPRTAVRSAGPPADVAAARWLVAHRVLGGHGCHRYRSTHR